MKKSILPTLISAFVLLSCEKLDIDVPVQVINMDGSKQSRFFEDEIREKLGNRNFILVDHAAQYQFVIGNFQLQEYTTTERVYDDCSGQASYTLHTEEVEGEITLFENDVMLQQWGVFGANFDVLRVGDPLLLEILFPDEEEDYCSNYFVKTKCKMDKNLRTCARRVAGDAVRKLNRLN